MKNILTILLVTLSFAAFSQSYSLGKVTSVIIEGTSTLHDWEMESEESMGSAVLSFEDGKLNDVKSLNFKIKSETLKSGKSTMDNIAYESLKTEDHPTIEFTLTDVKKIAGNEVSATGKLSIAGVTKDININALTSGNQSNFIFEGGYTLDMTDYGMEPPTAMFGTIKTGEEIKVIFKVNCTK